MLRVRSLLLVEALECPVALDLHSTNRTQHGACQVSQRRQVSQQLDLSDEQDHKSRTCHRLFTETSPIWRARGKTWKEGREGKRRKQAGAGDRVWGSGLRYAERGGELGAVCGDPPDLYAVRAARQAQRQHPHGVARQLDALPAPTTPQRNHTRPEEHDQHTARTQEQHSGRVVARAADTIDGMVAMLSASLPDRLGL